LTTPPPDRAVTDRDLQPGLVRAKRKVTAKPWPGGSNPRVRKGRSLKMVDAAHGLGVDCGFCDWSGSGAKSVDDALWTYDLHCMLEGPPHPSPDSREAS
jgi:hypothetical protein